MEQQADVEIPEDVLKEFRVVKLIDAYLEVAIYSPKPIPFADVVNTALHLISKISDLIKMI